MEEVLLYDSTVCRLCAEENDNGEFLYSTEGDNQDLGSMVNRYLPIKIKDDGKLSRTICPGCNIQLQSTIQFFELLVDGQRKIREMWKNQLDQQRKAEKDRLRVEKENTTDLSDETSELNIVVHNNEENQFEQQIIIKIMPDGSMYAGDHEISLQMEGLTKPKRKRGRPPKTQSDMDTKEDTGEGGSQGEEDKPEEEIEVDGDGRRRRKRKVPKRFMEAVQGKELERIFKEEGVLDEEDGVICVDLEDPRNVPIPHSPEEIIGHLETEEGKDLGELVIVHKPRNKGKQKLGRRRNTFTCQLCGRGFSQRSKYILHKNSHKGSKYKCGECSKIFINQDKLFLHKKTIHNSKDVLEISEKEANNSQTRSSENDENVVSNQLESNKNIIEWNEKTENDESIVCEICDKKFQTEQSFELHVRGFHFGDTLLSCNTCDETFLHKNTLEEHILTHEGNKSDKNFPCDVCSKTFNHPSSVVYHKEAEHNNGRRFVCNKCGKAFKHKQLLQRHQLVHSDNRPYVCKCCNASFKTKANLINHQSTHTGEKKYFCEICGQQFAHKTSLTLHYRWHTGHKPYKCDVCNKSFSQNGNLQEHMRIHTGEKPYCCDYCGRKFTTSSQFKLHVKRHTGERPWKCEFCAKCFLHKDTWKCHVRRHKGERPFQCTYCNRGFTEQWALKKHLRLHTGEKPYTCDVCGKAFSDCSNLTKHKKVHRENKASNLNGTTERPALAGLWQILPPESQQSEQNSLNSKMDQIITANDNEGLKQFIYVSYQDADDSDQSKTLHLVGTELVKDKENISINGTQSLSQLTIDDLNPSSENSIGNENQNNRSKLETDLQLQITDEDGNAIPLSIQDARQLLTQGQFISHLPNGQTIRIHSGVYTQELLDSCESQDFGDKSEDNLTTFKSIKDITTGSGAQSDADAIVKVLEDEDTNATTVASINQLETDVNETFEDDEQTIEFTTQDGQRLRLITPYHVDPIQLASEYLTII